MCMSAGGSVTIECEEKTSGSHRSNINNYILDIILFNILLRVAALHYVRVPDV